MTQPLATERVDEHGSLAWMTHPQEWMQRASLALALEGGGCALIDPVDHPALDAAIAGLGRVHSVVNLVDRHGRACDLVAARHGAARLGPIEVAWPGALGADVEGRVVLDAKRWSESCLWLPDRSLLVCAEALGTAPHYRAGGEPLGVHPLLRLRPPQRVFGDLAPTAIAVGHGPPLLDGAAAALDEALRTARTRLPRAWAGALVQGVRRKLG